MKKSKILAVALSALTFSTAAAVTGTVAWYFAQRTVSVSMTNITSFNPESGLQVSLTEGIGTKYVDNDSHSTHSSSKPAAISHGLIRDGSVDLVNKKAYTAILNSQGNAVVGYRQLDLATATDMAGEVTKVGETDPTPYYYATSYTATFELYRKEAGKTFAVYYDNSQLKVGGSSFVQESLRIGFVFDAGTADDSDDSFFVVAPFRDEKGYSYINSEDVSDPKGDYRSIGNPDNRMIYGYETTYKRLGDANGIITGDDGVDVQIPEFDKAHLDSKGFYSDSRYVDVNREVPGSDPVVYAPVEEVAYEPSTENAAPTDDNLAGLGVVHAGQEADTLGYLGNLVADAETGDDGLAINVTVYTWFEGTDPSSISDWVDDEALTVELAFNMAEVVA